MPATYRGQIVKCCWGATGDPVKSCGNDAVVEVLQKGDNPAETFHLCADHHDAYAPYDYKEKLPDGSIG